MRVCPERDAPCPAGKECPYADTRYRCKEGWRNSSVQIAHFVELPDDASGADVAAAFATVLDQNRC